MMQADLRDQSSILGQKQDTYVTFLVRENTSRLSAAQLGVKQSHTVAGFFG